jgi:Family of unknown function (DUF6510)
MSQPTHLDGNSVAALLHDVFGEDVTGHRGCCDHCGTVSRLAAILVYRDCPGDVLRCPGCGSVVMVLVTTPWGIKLGMGSLRWIEV